MPVVRCNCIWFEAFTFTFSDRKKRQTHTNNTVERSHQVTPSTPPHRYCKWYFRISEDSERRKSPHSGLPRCWHYDTTVQNASSIVHPCEHPGASPASPARARGHAAEILWNDENIISLIRHNTHPRYRTGKRISRAVNTFNVLHH